MLTSDAPQIPITPELVQRAGERFMTDGMGGGQHVRDLASWKHEGFRMMVAGFLASGLVREDADVILRKQADQQQAQTVTDRRGIIPAMYHAAPDIQYARMAWESVRQFSGKARNAIMAGKHATWILITGKSGRGKSHMAGNILMSAAHHADIAWINCEELDAAIKMASGGDRGADDMRKIMMHAAASSVYTCLDDFGKPDTSSDGVSLPTRIQPLHSMIESARLADPRRGMIITSEYAPSQLERRVSAGVVNRIMELAVHVTIDEPATYRGRP